MLVFEQRIYMAATIYYTLLRMGLFYLCHSGLLNAHTYYINTCKAVSDITCWRVTQRHSALKNSLEPREDNSPSISKLVEVLRNVIYTESEMFDNLFLNSL